MSADNGPRAGSPDVGDALVAALGFEPAAGVATESGDVALDDPEIAGWSDLDGDDSSAQGQVGGADGLGASPPDHSSAPEVADPTMSPAKGKGPRTFSADDTSSDVSNGDSANGASAANGSLSDSHSSGVKPLDSGAVSGVDQTSEFAAGSAAETTSRSVGRSPRSGSPVAKKSYGSDRQGTGPLRRDGGDGNGAGIDGAAPPADATAQVDAASLPAPDSYDANATVRTDAGVSAADALAEFDQSTPPPGPSAQVGADTALIDERAEAAALLAAEVAPNAAPPPDAATMLDQPPPPVVDEMIPTAPPIAAPAPPAAPAATPSPAVARESTSSRVSSGFNAGELAARVLDPSILKRSRRVRARKVRRVVRHIDPWSVLTFSVLFFLCLYAALLLSSVLVWHAAVAAGTLEQIESFIRELGDYETFKIQGDVVFRAAMVIAGILTLASSVLIVLLVVVFNLISDLIGGIRLTVIEEEIVRVRRRNE